MWPSSHPHHRTLGTVITCISLLFSAIYAPGFFATLIKRTSSTRRREGEAT
jgi:hypothetical protein